MGGMGWTNPIPFEIGGGETDTERTYLELRKAVGEGGAGPPDGIEDVWRQAKAQQVAASQAADERALLQQFPNLATDHLDVYEAELGIPREATEAERQIACARAVVQQLEADIPSIRTDLQRIDPQADVESVDYAQAVVVLFGKMFAPRTGGAAYSAGQATRQASDWPNYSTDFVLHVRYTLAVGQTIPSAVKLAAIRRYLNGVLPGWVDFVIYTGVGFYLDGGPDGTSLLDLTAFS